MGYGLTPSFLRKDELRELNINKYIFNSEFNFYLTKPEIMEIDGENEGDGLLNV